MDRRAFLKRCGAVSLAGAGTLLNPAGSGWLRFAHAGSGNGKTLVVIFQRGGCDGLNTVVPWGDPDYARHRPTLAIPAPGSAPVAALDLDGFFGLHPAMSALHTQYAEGRLAVFPAVHYPHASRSHFDGQRLIEGGSVVKRNDGWLNRTLAQWPVRAPLDAVALDTQLPFSLFGDRPVAAFDDLSGSLGAPADQETAIHAALNGIYRGTAPAEGNRARLDAAGIVALDLLDSLAVIDGQGNAPENGAVYPNTRFGQHLQRLAHLIKADVGLEIATLNIGGWDTHSGQGGVSGRHANLLQQFSDGLDAFQRDLAAYQNNLLVLSMTEFGRTVRQNGSGGTDHGKASAWFALGGGVQGGIHGDWPGLDDAALLDGRFLDHSIDFRDILAEVLERHLGLADAGAVLPDAGGSPVGFL